MKDSLEDILRDINTEAYDMACSVLVDPSRRTERLSREARSTAERLLRVIELLEHENPELAARWSRPVSESLLDLSYVAHQSPIVSLRLSRVMEQRKDRG